MYKLIREAMWLNQIIFRSDHYEDFSFFFVDEVYVTFHDQQWGVPVYDDKYDIASTISEINFV